MIYSMTGFASVTRDIGVGVLTLELKSVNSRYLDLNFRMHDDLRSTEPVLREMLAAKITRGKLECRASFQPALSNVASVLPNEVVLRRLVDWQVAVQRHFPDAAKLSIAEILNWPGVFGEQGTNRDAALSECPILARAALEDFLATRAREGAKLAAMISERVSDMRALVERVKPMVPNVVADYQEKLASRLREAVASFDEDRVRQEVGIFAARVDIAEEISRLSAHLGEVERVLRKGGAVGKRLDFIMQELNREANTLASKSVAADLTAIAVEMKLLIEQMREQVQNIE